MRAQAGFTPHVAELGQGPRKALALHCTLAFSGAWKGIAQRMGAEVTLIAPDMPSHGRSADWDEQSNFSDTVYQAALSCMSEPMDVIGHSFGGATALRLAVNHPELVRSLTLIEPVFFHIAAVDDPEAMQGHNDPMAPILQNVRDGRREEAARAFNRMWSESSPPWPDLPEQLRAAMTRAIYVVPDTMGFLLEDEAGMVAKLDQVTMPVLLVHGATSENVVKVTNAGLAARMPDAQVADVPGAGHMAPISHPDAVAELWRDLLARTSSNGNAAAS